LAQENCTNGIDDDGDSLIDIQDPDCACLGTTTSVNIIPNPSFESINFCPMPLFTGAQGLEGFKQGSIVGWSDGNRGTTDNYRTNCPISGLSVPTAPSPIPHGSGYIGFHDSQNSYKEYAATCLTSPMTAGTTYTLTFNLGYGNTAGTTFSSSPSTTIGMSRPEKG